MNSKRLRGIFGHMHARCRGNDSYSAKYYKNRGITVCAEWSEFGPFEKWALDNGYSDNLTIDRIDNDGGYSPGNCRWVTHKENTRNRSDAKMVTAFGETKCVQAWSEDPRCSICARNLGDRLRKGWDVETAITHPSIQGNKRVAVNMRGVA